MRKILVILLVLMVGITVVLLAGCAQSNENRIVGKWIETDGSTTEFFKDGTVISVNEKKEMTVTGNYKFIEKDRMRIDLGGLLGALAGPLVVKVSISGNKMTWIMPDGKVEKFRKTK